MEFLYNLFKNKKYSLGDSVAGFEYNKQFNEV